MARALRIDHPGAWHHVVHRGIGRADIFHHDRDRSAFVDLLGELDERFRLEVHAYVLMGNHHHLLVHSVEGHLARAMRHLNGVYTQRHNWHHHRDGALFAGRYHSSLIEADTYLVRVATYVHRNPVAAGLTDAPDAYRWSSYAGYLDPGQAPSWLRRQAVLEYFGGSRAALHRFTVACDTDEELDTLELNAHGAPPAVLGSEAFTAAALAKVEVDPETEGARRRVRDRPSLQLIDEVVARAFGVQMWTLHDGRRGRANLARMVAVHLAVTHAGRTHAELAAHYGFERTRGVSSALTRLTERMSANPALGARIADLHARLRS